MSRAHDLYSLLEKGTSLGIVCHNNPDPDALASALALKHIATDAGISDSAILYSGTITHQQNRAFINLLQVDLVSFTTDQLANYDLIALVDHATPGANNDLEPETAIDIVIDHHPASGIEATFIDHREEIGATATILTKYLQELSIDIPESLATALLFAIRRETLNFLRGVTRAEYEAGGFLHSHADIPLLRQIAAPPLTPTTVDTIKRAIENRDIRNACLVTHIGRTTERDALPQAADYLVNLENVTTTVVAGIVAGTLHLSARSIDSGLHVGNLLETAFGDVGSVGGHYNMAGGQIPLGLFKDATDGRDELIDITSQIVAQRVFQAL